MNDPERIRPLLYADADTPPSGNGVPLALARTRSSSRNGNHALQHEALVYASEKELLAGTIPMIRRGLADGEAVFVATMRATATLLRDALGDDAALVDYADADAWYQKPLATLIAYRTYIEGRVEHGAPRVRIIGEVAWPSGGDGQVSAWTKYETTLNVAFAGLPLALLCAYDARCLPEDILVDARRTHPVLREGGMPRASVEYADPAELVHALDAQHRLPPTPARTAPRSFSGPSDARRFILDKARGAGVTGEALSDTEYAAGELAANAIQHGGGRATVRTWTVQGSFVYEVSDTGPGIADPLASYIPPPTMQAGGWGLVLARLFSDAMDIVSDASGTAVRLRVRTDGASAG